MLNQSLVIARKEVVDGLRDFRSVIASLLYALMGPLVVGLVSMAHPAGAQPGSSASILVGMMSAREPVLVVSSTSSWLSRS